MKLPFMQDTNWPISKEPEERVANPSYDMKVEDHLMDELLVALEKKNISHIRETIVALIQHLKSEG